MKLPPVKSSKPNVFRPRFAIPGEDLGEFNSLPNDVRKDVDRLLIEFERVFEADFADPALQKLSDRLDHRRGFRFHTLRKKYYLYLNGGEKGGPSKRVFEPGDWRCLVDYSRLSKLQKTGEQEVSLSKEFVEYLRGLFQSNKRKSAPAIRLLYRLWRAGESIPGYGCWQEWFQDKNPFEPLPETCPPDLPRGWSRGNLGTYIPEDADLDLSRKGIVAARAHLPDVMMSRAGLRPLELIQFDDVRVDFRILVPGFASPVQLKLLVAIDVATGMILRYGLRPAITRDDGKEDNLKLHDMKCLIAGILLQFGVPRYYKMKLQVENATAAIQDAFEAALRELSCGQIEVQRTMMINGTAIWGGYKDKAGGNPGGKGLIESTFNLMHNEAAFLPGQIGSRYDNGPAELQGRMDETKALQKIGRHLSPHDRARLKMPFLNADQARMVLTDLFNRIMRRDDHAMEDFQPVGEWRTAKFQQWRPEGDLQLPEFAHLNPDSDIQWRTPVRLETPFERWQRLMDTVGGESAFQRFHPGAIMRLYDQHRKAVIDNSEIVLKFNKVPHVYRIANIQHARRPLQNEMSVLVYYDEQDLNMIHITDGEGAFLGSIPRTRGARRADKAALKEQFDLQRAEMRKLQARVSDRMPEVAEEHVADLTHNNNVIRNAVESAEAINIAPTMNAEQLAAPAVAKDLMRARLSQQVQARQEAAKSQEIAETTPPPAAPDCTQDLLAQADTTAPGDEEEQWDA